MPNNRSNLADNIASPASTVTEASKLPWENPELTVLSVNLQTEIPAGSGNNVPG